MHSILEIKSLILPIHIGLTQQERKNKQDISLTITLGFSRAPKTEQTDQLQDSICYFEICEKIKQITSKQSFFLIEKLAYTIFTALKKIVPHYICIKVCVHKINPPVQYLKGGVYYTCGDKFL